MTDIRSFQTSFSCETAIIFLFISILSSSLAFTSIPGHDVSRGATATLHNRKTRVGILTPPSPLFHPTGDVTIAMAIDNSGGDNGITTRRRIQLHRPVRVLGIVNSGGTSGVVNIAATTTKLGISSGFTFDDGDQLLVSAIKPLGLLLEEGGQNDRNVVVVADVEGGGAAERAGVLVGDILVAVQNADVWGEKFEQVLDRIREAPKVVNLRFMRKD